MRLLPALLVVLATAFPAAAQTYEDIDVDLPSFPDMEPIADSPVYYAPTVESNYFYYDGQFWDYANDRWYASPFYNGPWSYVDPVYVPTYVLWVPIRYYRRPPASFRAWPVHRPPRWGEHWGRDWQARHNQVYRGVRTAPVRAPLPTYQRQFTRLNYPHAPQQQAQIRAQHEGHHPHDQGSRSQGEGHRERR